MIRFTGQLDVARLPEEVFELIADMDVLDRWNPNVSSSRRISGERLAPGSQYESTIVRGPIRMTAKSELVAVETGRMVRYEGSIAGFWSIDSLAFEAWDHGTRITFRNETRTPRWFRPFELLLNAAFQPQARRAVEGAERYLATLPS